LFSLPLKILTAEQIRIVDALTIKLEPIASLDLMERAALACYNWIHNKFDNNIEVLVFAGPGNNVSVYLTNNRESLSSNTIINYDRLKSIKGVSFYYLENCDDFPRISKNQLVIDALFGSGISRPITGVDGKLVNHINESGATIISIDIPSGLQTEKNTYSEPLAIIKAKYTLTFQTPKLSFFFAENESFVGEWIILDIHLSPIAMDEQETPYYYTSSEEISRLLHHRKKFSHKGNYGHALLMAGSYGKMGAAVLASKACMRSGVGLLTTQVPKKGYEIIQTLVPEAMTIVDDNSESISIFPMIFALSLMCKKPHFTFPASALSDKYTVKLELIVPALALSCNVVIWVLIMLALALFLVLHCFHL